VKGVYYFIAKAAKGQRKVSKIVNKVPQSWGEALQEFLFISNRYREEVKCIKLSRG